MKKKAQNPPAKKRGVKQKSKASKALATKGKNKQKAKASVSDTRGKQYSFFENVYEVARLIPRGRVTSYGAIAKYLGTGKSARLVGYAMNGCSKEVPVVPAHRVLNRNGMLTGKHHFSPPSLMQELLEKEGVKVRKDTVINFKIVFWDPQKELAL